MVLFEGETVGYTIGNDVGSRDIEGENPLYLPPDEDYERCGAIGTGRRIDRGRSGRPRPRDIDGHPSGRETMFEGTTRTAEIVRSCVELVSSFRRCTVVSSVAVFRTGTSLVPPESFTLRAGDLVTTDIDSIGTLRNTVVAV